MSSPRRIEPNNNNTRIGQIFNEETEDPALLLIPSVGEDSKLTIDYERPSKEKKSVTWNTNLTSLLDEISSEDEIDYEINYELSGLFDEEF